MAVLAKIRERSMFLIIIIGLALFAFVLDPSTLGDFFNSSKVNEIGEINGETISRQAFASELEAYKQQAGNRISEMQASKNVWDNIVRKKIYQNQLSEAGITVGESDVWREVINAGSVQNNPQFQNEIGTFDESKFKQFLADTKENNSQMWAAWSNYMNKIRENAEKNTYNNLVTAGLGASLKEGEFQYFSDNTKLTTQFVFVPYSSIADSLVSVSKSEISSYIKENATNFKVDESRDISYVKFDIAPTSDDENIIKEEVASFIEDLKTSSNEKEFLDENDSDSDLDENFKFENSVNKTVSSDIFKASKGTVVGPYKDKGFFKISKITAINKMPDSVKASHILIPFVGAQRVAPEITRTEDEAKKLADSILKVVKRNRSKFARLAKDFSSDRGSAEKGGFYDWFNYSRMTPEFRDFVFEGKKREIGVVKTPYGYHVIKIDGQKNFQRVVKLATFSRKIVASETTENAVFQESEQFALSISKDKKFFQVANENKYKTKPAIGLKALDEFVPGLGSQRQIVSWAFGKETTPGDFKRFDLEGSHVVAFVTAKTEKGLLSAAKATNKVKPILINEKKAQLIAEKFSGNTLEALSKENATTIKKANGVTLKNPTLAGAGSEPKAFVLTNKELPSALPNYESLRKNISAERKRKTIMIYEAIKKASDVQDNRASLYTAN